MRILWLKTELLHPIDKGGKIRTYFTLKELLRRHHVTYLTLDDGLAGPDAVERADEYCHELIRIPHTPARKFSFRFYAELAANLVSRLPYAIARYRCTAMERRIRELVSGGGYDLLVCDFLTPDVNVPRSLPVPAVLFQHNVEAMIWKRHTEVQSGALKTTYFSRQWRKMARYERDACQRYDHVIAVSDDDRDEMRRAYGVQRVDAVPTGVDTAYFTPSGDVAEKRGNVVFVGSMDWLPNDDAVDYFANEIWPLIRRDRPDASFTIVGRNPRSALRALADRGDGIEVTGRVDDVRPYLERASLTVVPLRIGGGTRLKIYEAMAMGRPTVSTTIGAEGLPVGDGEELYLADEPAEFARYVLDLLDDPDAARAMGQRAQERVRADFSWEIAAKPFIDICERVVGQHHRPGNQTNPALNQTGIEL